MKMRMRMRVEWRLCVLLCVYLLRASASSHQFSAFRMQQYNTQQDEHGCRGAVVVAAEARSPQDVVLTRRCVVLKLQDFSTPLFLQAQKQNAAAMLLLLPRNLSALEPHVLQGFMEAETEALAHQSLMPVFVAREDEQLLGMYEEVSQAAASRSASVLVRVLRSIVTATAFQILVSDSAPIRPVPDTAIITLEGVLPGATEDSPTILITAHYDTFGLAPWLAFGADSNASGVVILLELVRLFQRLYRDSRTRAPFHLMFSLTGGGKHHFLGTKRWLEENMDHAESSLLHDNVAFVLCLDSLGAGDQLFLHEPRPARPGSARHRFAQQLRQVVSDRFPWVSVRSVQRKAGPQDGGVLWEHERYGERRISAFSLSHIEDPRSELRGSILDTMTRVDVRKLKRNGVIVAESLARFIYNLSDKGDAREAQVFRGSLEVADNRVAALMSALTSVPRATQLMDREPEQTQLMSSLQQQFTHYLKQVHTHRFRQDPREPDITFFDQMRASVMMYRVKPAAFDLFLGGCIAGYLGLVYCGVQNFGSVFVMLTAAAKSKRQ